jgi:EAL domain-containing protein (putative c-di-GMP-specific phosphodiesterase class I)
MTKGHSNRIFIAVIAVSFLCAVADIAMELANYTVSLTGQGLFIAQVSSYLYFITRNSTIAGYFFFVFAVTGTWYRVRPRRRKAIILIPYAVIILLLATNPFTNAVFSVTPYEGYKRGSMMIALYAISGLYAFCGTAYLIISRKFLSRGKLLSLIAMYLLSMIAVLVQFFFPSVLMEMVATSFSMVIIVLFVMRPEEISDASVGSLSFNAYRNELRRILMTKQRVQIAVICFTNANTLRAYLGEERYLAYASHVVDQLDAVFRRERVFFGIYFEHPGTIYIIVDDPDYSIEDAYKRLTSELRRGSDKAASAGERIVPRCCNIVVPDDLSDIDEIVKFGRGFHTQMKPNCMFVNASEIIASRDYRIVSNMDTILNRAIQNNSFNMYYQPIYSTEKKRFISAEALIRLTDDEFGFISPGLFIPAAEKRGVILPIGDFVLEDVFRFISGTDMEKLGLEYIEINLSVAQCMQEELPEKLAILGDKYGVTPDRVNLEITETTYENTGNVMEFNLEALSGMGYSFSLDDYGTGYSNMQRVSKLPLKIIKLDKTLIDDMGTDEGKSIVRNTIKMMRDIDKELVAEGVETKEDLELLEEMGCNFIQGYYFSKPLPEQEFTEFIKKHNNADA